MAKKGASAPRQHAPATTDARFVRLHTDPRFLRPQRDDAKVAVDDRFKSLLGGGAGAAGAGGDFGIHKRNAKVDRFGRKTKKGRNKEDEEIQRLYKVEGEDEDEDEEESDEEEDSEDEEDESAAGPIDYARGAVELESSGEEDSSDEDDDEDSDSDSSDASGDVAIGSAAVLRRERKRRAQHDESDSDSENDDDDEEEASDVDEAAEKEIDPRALAALDAQAERAVAEASSSEAGPSTSKAAASSSKRSKRKQQATIAPGSETRRLAIVNMDWDHVRALDIYKVFSSLVSPHATRLPGTEVAAATGSNGRPGPSSQQVKGLVESVRVYPSDFGRERMKREDVEGPPREIFKTAEDDAATARRKAKNKKKNKKRRDADSDSDDSDDAIFEVDEGAEFDDAALRAYQLDRLRYYYAIATFDCPLSARHVYDIVDGAEMERTANIFDLQFVPDEMDFPDLQEDKDQGVEGWRDEAKPGVDDAVGYKGADWATDALRHSKVKLTWDAPDPERMKVTRMRNMTKGEIRDDDFRAYLASDSEGGEEDEEEDGAEAAKGKGAGAGRDRFRALLGLDDNASSGSGGKNGVFGRSRSSAFEDAREDGEEEDGDMEITFLPGLSEAAARKAAGGSAKDAADKEETTLEKYMRKQREKKERRRAARGEKVDEDEEAPRPQKEAAAADSGKDLGFDDPFFASGGEEDEDLDAILAKEQAEEAKQKGKKNKRATTSQTAAPPATTNGGVDAGDESEDDGRHFSMQDVLKAEQAKAGKKPNRWERKKLAKLAKRAAADGDSNDATAAALAQQKKKLEAQPDFKLDTADPRFFSANTLDDHRFAVDPTHPSYMKTEGMQRALEERRKRGGGKKGAAEEDGEPQVQSSKGSKQQDGKKRKQEKMDGGEAAGGGDASELLAAIKRREKEQQGRKGLKAGKKQRTDK